MLICMDVTKTRFVVASKWAAVRGICLLKPFVNK